MYKWSTKLLVGITIFLFLGGASLVSVAYNTLKAPTVEVQANRPTRHMVVHSERSTQVPTLLDTVKENAWNGLTGKMRFQFSSGRIYLTLGLFILGFIVGRIRLFERLDEFRKRLLCGAMCALVLIGLLYVARSYLPPVDRGELSLNSWMNITSTNLINLLTAYLWVIAVIESYRLQKVQQAMKPLVSYGRMGLTNYIVQSVTGVFIFSGFGLNWSCLGVFLSVSVVLFYTSIQILFSHYWLKMFSLWADGMAMANRHLHEMATNT